jgi:ribonuclease-3
VDRAAGVLADLRLSDFKSLLIEHCQARFRSVPELLVAEETGPEHGKTFVVVVRINGEIMGRGEGRSKKLASQMACREALISLNYPLL